MKTRTVRNPNHPHNILKTYLARKKKELSEMSNLKLGQAIRRLRASQKLTGRSQRIKACLAVHEKRFKRDWETKFGWPFDDSYDANLLQKHIDDLNQKAKQSNV